MESTGVDSIPLFQILETQGFEVKLVNAHHVKTVPERKPGQSWSAFADRPYEFGYFDTLTPHNWAGRRAIISG